MFPCLSAGPCRHRGRFLFSWRRLFPYSAQCWLRQWIRVLRQFWCLVANSTLFHVKVDSGSSRASPEEYKKSGLLLEMTSGTMSVFRHLPGSTVDPRPRVSLRVRGFSREGGLFSHNACFDSKIHVLRQFPGAFGRISTFSTCGHSAPEVDSRPALLPSLNGEVCAVDASAACLSLGNLDIIFEAFVSDSFCSPSGRFQCGVFRPSMAHRCESPRAQGRRGGLEFTAGRSVTQMRCMAWCGMDRHVTLTQRQNHHHHSFPPLLPSPPHTPPPSPSPPPTPLLLPATHPSVRQSVHPGHSPRTLQSRALREVFVRLWFGPEHGVARWVHGANSRTTCDLEATSCFSG